jgi:hypothetical protein
MNTGRYGSAAQPRHGAVSALTALAALLWIAGGCTQHDLDLGRGGLSAEDDARWSQALAQVRAQAPQDRVSGLVYESRPEPAGLTEPELALTGEADSVTRGFQTGERSHVRLSVYLDKSSYTRGYLKVSRDGAPEETWPIAAYVLRGQADRDFQFTYLVSEPGGALRAFMLIGGGYQEDGDELVAIEGALIVPDAPSKTRRVSAAAWRTAYPFAFVLKEPKRPAYDDLVFLSEELARELGQNVADLERLSKRLDAQRAESGAARGDAAPPAAPSSAPPAAAPASRQDDRRSSGLELQLRQQSEAASEKAVHYFELRGEADSLLAAYLEGNSYRWRDADGREQVFARWEAPERHAADMDLLIGRLLPYVSSPQKIEQARAAFRATVAKNRNAEKRPPVRDN